MQGELSLQPVVNEVEVEVELHPFSMLRIFLCRIAQYSARDILQQPTCRRYRPRRMRQNPAPSC
jgi:hypothetical protein